MRNWIIEYQDQNGNSNKARVVAAKYGDALDKADNVITKMNNIYKEDQRDTVFKLMTVESFEAYEDWTNI